MDKCKRCGRCCVLRFWVGYHVEWHPEVRCQYLGEDGLCKEYGRRGEFWWCETAEVSGSHGLLPEGCGYLEG